VTVTSIFLISFFGEKKLGSADEYRNFKKEKRKKNDCNHCEINLLLWKVDYNLNIS